MANMIFNLDLNKNNAINPIIFGRLTDGNLRKITVNITNEGEPVNLTDWVIRFEGATGGQAKVFDVLGVQLLDAKNGKFEYTFSKTAFSASGAYKSAYFAIEKDDMRETTNDIKIIVENVADLDAQDAQTVVTELNKTITLINERYAELNGRVGGYADDIAELENWLTSRKAEIENIIDLANSNFTEKLTEIQTKLDETNQAINNGDFYTKTETDQKLSAINTTITSHTNDKANPHAVTASQVGAYSKQEIDTKLSKAVMTDDSGKVTINDLVADSITLPDDTDGWITLQNLRYKKKNGLVSFWFDFTTTTAGTAVVGTFPPGFIPPNDVMFVIVNWATTTASSKVLQLTGLNSSSNKGLVGILNATEKTRYTGNFTFSV